LITYTFPTNQKPDYMGHFTINLPENKLGNVRSGKVRHKQILPFSKSKKLEHKTGYIVRVPGENEEVYTLYKSKDGRWTTDIQGEKELESYIHFYLKYFIIERENSSH
jgi:hypothetical protein